MLSMNNAGALVHVCPFSHKNKLSELSTSHQLDEAEAGQTATIGFG